jgi:hypothetical protein
MDGKALFEKIQRGKGQPFLSWPVTLQRIVLCVGFFICYLSYGALFDVETQKIEQHKKQTATLLETIVLRKKTIQEASQKHRHFQPVQTSYFIRNFSMLAKKNHLEIISIKPYMQSHTSQIHLSGNYAHVFTGMQEIHHMPEVSILGDFNIRAALENKVDVKIAIEAHPVTLQKKDASDIKTIGILHRNPFEKLTYPLSVDENIKRYSFSIFKLKGTMQNGQVPWAVLSDPENHLYFLKLHDAIGLEKAEIVDISTGKIALKWQMEGHTYTDYLET